LLGEHAGVSTPHTDPAVDAAQRVPRRAAVIRLARYAFTSVAAFAISEITLLVLVGTKTTGATVAALAANLAGTVPSYLLSRYWIWSEAPRTRVGRQAVLYWTTSIVCIAATSLATGAIAGLVPAGDRLHLVVAGVGFFGVNIVFWFAKFVVYQRIIFPVDRQPAGLTAEATDPTRPPDLGPAVAVGP
jgi:putative flippase GtrA